MVIPGTTTAMHDMSTPSTRLYSYVGGETNKVQRCHGCRFIVSMYAPNIILLVEHSSCCCRFDAAVAVVAADQTIRHHTIRALWDGIT